MTEKRRSAPQRRRGETRGDARKRFRSAGLCQRCGRKKNTKGPICTRCLAEKKRGR